MLAMRRVPAPLSCQEVSVLPEGNSTVLLPIAERHRSVSDISLRNSPSHLAPLPTFACLPSPTVGATQGGTITSLIHCLRTPKSQSLLISPTAACTPMRRQLETATDDVRAGAVYPPGIGWTPVAAGITTRPLFYNPALVATPTSSSTTVPPSPCCVSSVRSSYPPGMGLTPVATVRNTGLAEKGSLLVSTPKAVAATPRMFVTTPKADENAALPRDLLLFFRNGVSSQEKASSPEDVGFSFPTPGWIRSQAKEGPNNVRSAVAQSSVGPPVNVSVVEYPTGCGQKGHWQRAPQAHRVGKSWNGSHINGWSHVNGEDSSSNFWQQRSGTNGGSQNLGNSVHPWNKGKSKASWKEGV
eukprot:TRINITY_DN49014_c0_g1_i1.p1 TRINITY_DN49014_c0_g1~~TRINITY_DN49014_c0_g1_i1.p1  ORF type:complete len:379 (-),score=47.01 TRINITY_DN49014_c0_g1_i1:91-1158(-)